MRLSSLWRTAAVAGCCVEGDRLGHEEARLGRDGAESWLVAGRAVGVLGSGVFSAFGALPPIGVMCVDEAGSSSSSATRFAVGASPAGYPK